MRHSDPILHVLLPTSQFVGNGQARRTLPLPTRASAPGASSGTDNDDPAHAAAAKRRTLHEHRVGGRRRRAPLHADEERTDGAQKRRRKTPSAAERRSHAGWPCGHNARTEGLPLTVQNLDTLLASASGRHAAAEPPHESGGNPESAGPSGEPPRLGRGGLVGSLSLVGVGREAQPAIRRGKTM